MSNRAAVALVVALGPILTGCRSAASVRGLSLDEGVRAHYAVAPSQVTAAVSAAMAESGAGSPEITRPAPADAETGASASTTVLLATCGMSLASYGAHTRVVVRGDGSGGHTEVRALSRSQGLLDLSGRADRRAPRLLRSLDQRLGAGAIAPYEGMRVRGRVSEGATIVGTARRAEDDGWVVTGGSGATAVPMDALADVSAWRGSYSHRAEWALGLGLVGWVVGLVLPVDDCGRGSLAGYCTAVSRVDRGSLGLAVGALSGALVGSLHRTQVWSPMRPVEGAGPGAR